MEIQNLAKSELEALLNQIGISNVEITVELKEEDSERKYIWLKVEGEEATEIIGFHGKILDSLQNILTMFLEEKLREENCGIIVEVNSYREDRMKYIENVTRRAIVEVKENQQDMELSPMKSFERRIVHMVAKEEGLETESIGEGFDRRVVIKFAQE